jgi:hypothetical protein
VTTPASNCTRCKRPGFVSQDQQSHTAGTPGGRLTMNTRFACQCNHEWTANTEETLAFGRFLDKARLR